MSDQDWWRGALVYQIYPRSYKDTSGNGVGDLPGITEKLYYVASLGVDAIWISPFFTSPMKDYGYDVADYRGVDPLFGTTHDFETLLDRAHNLGLKVIIDMVLSHTSDQHPWFQESKTSRDNDKSDWYVWVDPKPDGSPPNNWVSVFGGSAWQFDVWRGQYYLHNFLKEQPDLNVHNPKVREALLSECRYWLDMGVDGFRLDAINFAMHDEQLRDNPPSDSDLSGLMQLDFPDTYSMQEHLYSKTQPENLSFMKEIRKLLNEYEGAFAVAEIGDKNGVKVSAEYTADETLLHTAYSFDMMGNRGETPDARYFRDVIERQAAEPGNSWPAWAFSNHDVVRAASRWVETEYGHDQRLSKMLVMLLCSLRGMAFIYQGEELGLPEARLEYDEIHDPWGKYLYPKWQGRDGCRTPMPWRHNLKHASFTKGDDPWLPVPRDHYGMAVTKQEEDNNSTLNSSRRFMKWRRSQKALQRGGIEFVDGLDPRVLGFYRILGDEKILCLFNLSENEQTLNLDDFKTMEPQGVNGMKKYFKLEDGKVTMDPYATAFFK